MKSRSLLFFYLLALYVFASFTWWSYLLLEKNENAFAEQIKYERLRHNLDHRLPENSTAYFQTDHYQKNKNHFLRQKWMIIGEGAVFMVLLLVGSVRLWRTFKKEIELARQQNNFLLSITHELKSPLASMKLAMQTLVMRAQLDEKFLKLTKNSIDDVDRLSELVDNILYAARMEDADFSLHREPMNVSEIVNQIIEKIKITHKDDLRLSAKIEQDIWLKSDKIIFAAAISNLIENAIKYSPERSSILVSLAKQDDSIIFEVQDEGRGIPEHERIHIFKKFYRIGNEETRSTKGTGLGLFIVKKVADLHEGKIIVKDNHPRGTVMQMILPAHER